MLRTLLVVFTAVVFTSTQALAADDPWAKVKDLKSGTELRVYKKGASQPLLVKMGEVTDENLVVVNKNEQIAVPKDQIDRVDFRPVKSRVTKETKTTVSNGGEAGPPTPGPNQNAGGPTSSTSTNVSFGSKADFETIYRRQAGAPKK
jgi:hypothetical protein